MSDNTATLMLLRWIGGTDVVNDWLDRHGLKNTRLIQPWPITPEVLGCLACWEETPYRRGDFTERDQCGRDIEVLIFRRYAILYRADHPVKEVKVTALRYADR